MQRKHETSTADIVLAIAFGALVMLVIVMANNAWAGMS